MFKEDPEVLKRLPDPDMQTRPIDRTFVYNVINTVRGDYLQQFAVQSQDRSTNLRMTNVSVNSLVIPAHLIDVLCTHPYQCGKSHYPSF